MGCVNFNKETDTCGLSDYLCGYEKKKRCHNFGDDLEDMMIEPVYSKSMQRRIEIQKRSI